MLAYTCKFTFTPWCSGGTYIVLVEEAIMGLAGVAIPAILSELSTALVRVYLVTTNRP